MLVVVFGIARGRGEGGVCVFQGSREDWLKIMMMTANGVEKDVFAAQQTPGTYPK